MSGVDFTADTAPIIGLVIIASGFTLFAGLELAMPFRRAVQPKARRWLTNLALVAVDNLAVRLLLPLAMVGTALLAQERGWGLLNAVALPGWLAFALTLLALDLALWCQHRATHHVPWLWRAHRVHHSDRDFDVTTAVRFHPVEVVLSMGWKMVVVAALGAPALAVAVFETGFALFALWTHSNLALPVGVERVVRKIIVTPNLHRIHHSVLPRETNSNYGTALTAWDRLFGTYRCEARDPQESMTIGLAEWQDDRPARIGFSLLLPFARR